MLGPVRRGVDVAEVVAHRARPRGEDREIRTPLPLQPQLRALQRLADPSSEIARFPRPGRGRVGGDLLELRVPVAAQRRRCRRVVPVAVDDHGAVRPCELSGHGGLIVDDPRQCRFRARPRGKTAMDQHSSPVDGSTTVPSPAPGGGHTRRAGSVIALGVGTSHTPMLCMTPSSWCDGARRGEDGPGGRAGRRVPTPPWSSGPGDGDGRAGRRGVRHQARSYRAALDALEAHRCRGA